MRITTLFAIYFLFWFLSLFLVLPWGVRTAEEAGVEKVPGQADSAPAHFPGWRIVGITSLVAAAFMTLFLLNYNFGWLTTADLIAMVHHPE